MDLQDYTPEAICRALGLDGFSTGWKRGLPMQELTALLCPSFSPELHLAFWDADGQTNVRATCAESQIWGLPQMATVSVVTEVSVVGDQSLAALEQEFRKSLEQSDKRGVVTLDGMTVHIAWRNFDSRVVVERANPGEGDALGRFVSALVNAAFAALNDERCRDALARAGGYVGLELPLSVPVETKPKTHIGVLGTPEGRAEVLAAIQASREKKRDS